MNRALTALFVAMVIAAPALSQAPQRHAAVDPPALRLMNDSEFDVFLKKLDADALDWETRLKTLDVSSLRLGTEDSKEIGRSYTLCYKAIENTREDIQNLTHRQVLKNDFMLLVDLDRLARNLDRLSSDLANASSVQQAKAAQNSLRWARVVLGIDRALASHTTEFQHHVLAFASLVDVTLANAESNSERFQNPQ